MRKNSLVCERLSIFRGSLTILENISFTAMQGACIQVAGKNGSGKTSLIRCLARLDNSNLGLITYNNCNIDEFIDEYKQILLYISDKDQLDDDMTIYEIGNIYSIMYGSEMLLPAAVQTLDLEEYLDYQIKTLSKGTRKRVILMRLILQKARLWLLDEPFSNLDKHSINLIQNLFEVHTSNGGIVIFSDNQDVFEEGLAKTSEIIYSKACDPQNKKNKVLLRTEDFFPI
jgi:heme exporter protein A